MKSITNLVLISISLVLIACGGTDRVGSPRETPKPETQKVWVSWTITGSGGDAISHGRIRFNGGEWSAVLPLPQSGGDWIETGSETVLEYVTMNPDIMTQGEIRALGHQIGFATNNSGSFSLPAVVK